MVMITLRRYIMFFLLGTSVHTFINSMELLEPTIAFNEVFDEKAPIPQGINQKEASLCCTILYKIALKEFEEKNLIMFDTRNHLQCHLNAQRILEIYHQYKEKGQIIKDEDRNYLTLAFYCSTYFSPTLNNQRTARFKCHPEFCKDSELIQQEVENSGLYTANVMKKKFFGKFMTFCGFAPLYNHAKKLLLNQLFLFVEASLKNKSIPENIIQNQQNVIEDVLSFLQKNKHQLFCTSEEKKYQEIRIPGFIGGLALVCNIYRLMHDIPVLIKTKIVCPHGIHYAHKLFGSGTYRKSDPVFVLEGASCDSSIFETFSDYVGAREGCPFLLLDNIGTQHDDDDFCCLCKPCKDGDDCPVFQGKIKQLKLIDNLALFLLAMSANFTESQEKNFIHVFKEYHNLNRAFTNLAQYASEQGTSGSNPSTFIPEHAHPNILACKEIKERFLDFRHEELNNLLTLFDLLKFKN